ncbi:hypothetical protein D3C78_1769300 [compost metagenome]
MTCTTGGVICGYCSMERERIAASPASTMMIEITLAKMGRSMKNLENIRTPYLPALWSMTLAVMACICSAETGLTRAPGRAFISPSTT